MAETDRIPSFTARDWEGRSFTDRDLLAKAPALVVLLRGFT